MRCPTKIIIDTPPFIHRKNVSSAFSTSSSGFCFYGHCPAVSQSWSGGLHTQPLEPFHSPCRPLEENLKWLQPGFASAEWQTLVSWKTLNSSKEPWQSRSPILWPQTPSASSGLPEDLYFSYGEHTPRSPVSQKPLSIFMVYVQSSFQSSRWRWGVRKYQCSPEKFHKACQDSSGIIHCSPP